MDRGSFALARHATTEGTARYRERCGGRVHADHFRLYNDLWFPSIGMGIYLGNGEGDAGEQYKDLLTIALEAGCNHIDTALTHRSQRSEQVVGQALAAVFARGHVTRDEIIVSARGGSVVFEGEYPTDAATYVRRNLIEAKMAAADEFAQGWHHCMSPRYLRMQFRQSLTNLGLGALDIFYFHNPEVQRVERGPEVFERRLLAAFVELETQISTDRLASYGISTQDGFRVPPSDPGYLSLSRLVELARDASGDNHHFRYVHAPLNLAEREIATFKNQVVSGRERTLLGAAQELGIVVIGGETLWQGQLTLHLPEEVRVAVPAARTDAQAAIQWARSTPGLASSLVAMSSREHIEENMEVARWPVIPPADLATLLKNLTRGAS